MICLKSNILNLAYVPMFIWVRNLSIRKSWFWTLLVLFLKFTDLEVDNRVWNTSFTVLSRPKLNKHWFGIDGWKRTVCKSLKTIELYCIPKKSNSCYLRPHHKFDHVLYSIHGRVSLDVLYSTVESRKKRMVSVLDQWFSTLFINKVHCLFSVWVIRTTKWHSQNFEYFVVGEDFVHNSMMYWCGTIGQTTGKLSNLFRLLVN